MQKPCAESAASPEMNSALSSIRSRSSKPLAAICQGQSLGLFCRLQGRLNSDVPSSLGLRDFASMDGIEEQKTVRSLAGRERLISFEVDVA